MTLLSEAKVARRCASCGEAARRRRGGAGEAAEGLEGDAEVVGEDARVNVLAYMVKTD